MSIHFLFELCSKWFISIDSFQQLSTNITEHDFKSE